MKKIQLTMLQLYSLFKTHKVIFTIFTISSILCAMTYLFSYGNIVSYIGMRDSEERYLREYKVYLDDVQDVQSLINELEEFENPYIEEVFIGHNLYTSYGQGVYASLSETGTWKKRSGRIYFTEEELKEGNNVVIVPSGYNLADKICKIGTNEYEVIGSHKSSNIEYRVTLQNYINIGYKPQFVCFMAEKVPTYEIHNIIMQSLQTKFPGGKIENNFTFINSSMQNIPYEMLIITLIYGISVLGFVFLMAYMLESSYKDMVVYHIVGASHGDIAFLAMIEVLLLSIVTTTIAIVLHVLLYDTVISKINYVENLHYTINDYLLVFASSVVITQIINLPFIISLYKNSIMQLNKKYIGG